MVVYKQEIQIQKAHARTKEIFGKLGKTGDEAAEDMLSLRFSQLFPVDHGGQKTLSSHIVIETVFSVDGLEDRSWAPAPCRWWTGSGLIS